MSDEQIIEKNRLEYENIVIDYINRGWTKSEAQRAARERILDKYSEDENDEEND